jgi:ribosomal protein S18 acetylase RimI-like enzyme
VSEELERIVACHRDLQERLCDRFLASHVASGLFNSTLPRVWDRNYVRLEDPDANVGELIAVAERAHTLAGVAHRRIWVDHPGAGERLTPAFLAGGWSVQRLLVMVHRETEDEPDADLLAVAELDEHALRGIREEISVEYEDSPQLRAQLLFAQQIAAEELDVRYFGIRRGARIVSCCELYSRGGVAQIEDVVTVPDLRNQGLGRAVVLRALEAARSSGHDLVFLLADEEDWPKELYRRLGFEPIARLHAFLKRGEFDVDRKRD